jgi:LPXTG-motif cell wall-anchored protein
VRKTMTIVAGLAAAMMLFTSAALAQAPVDDPYFEEPTEEPTDGGGVSPGEVTPPPREEPEPSRQERPEEEELAETGMTASVGLVAGLGLLAMGGGLLVASRRRKSALQ